MQASWRLFLVHLALLVTGVALQVPPIVSLATALNYPMPNKNWCTWPGVTCAPSNEPQRIVWDNFNLTGTLPAVLEAAFNELEVLSLANNNITANIEPQSNPQAFYPVLQQLILSGNIGITGTVSVNLFKLPQLTRLDLSVTSVSGSIDYVTGPGTISLEYLLLEFAKLTGNFPQWLASAPNLISLKLGRNQITGDLPENLASLSNLVELNVFDNLLTGTIPAGYDVLTNLRVFRVGNNQLTGPIPDIFSGMQNFDTFEASYQALTGPIPPSLAALPNLQQLILPGTQLSGPLPFFAGPLTYLDVTGNSFTGTVPEWISHKVNLRTVALAGTNLTGTLPPFDLLTNLEVLALSQTKISGSIPKIGSQLLKTVKVSDTWLSGCWEQEGLDILTCAANNSRLCCAPEACLPLGTNCVPDDSVFTGPVEVTTITFTVNSTVTITADGTITVTGLDCVQFNGKLIVEIDYKKLNLTYNELVLMYYSCFNSSFNNVEFNQINQPQCIKDAGLKPEIKYSPAQLSIVLPKEDQCGSSSGSLPDWAIAVIVVGALIIVTGILLLALYCSPVREKVFPYAKK